MTRYLPLVIALAIVPACDKDKPKEESKKDTSAQASAKKKPTDKKKSPKKKGSRMAALSPDTPTTKLGEVPVSEDLEEEAERTVAIENLESELDRLEAEIVSVAQ